MSDARARRAALREIDKGRGVEPVGTKRGGLVLGVLLIAGLFAVVYALSMPIGRVTHEWGFVERMGLQESSEGSYLLAHVRVANRVGTVHVPRTANCRTGDKISLRGANTLMGGRRYRMGFGGCSR